MQAKEIWHAQSCLVLHLNSLWVQMCLQAYIQLCAWSVSLYSLANEQISVSSNDWLKNTAWMFTAAHWLTLSIWSHWALFCDLTYICCPWTFMHMGHMHWPRIVILCQVKFNRCTCMNSSLFTLGILCQLKFDRCMNSSLLKWEIQCVLAQQC